MMSSNALSIDRHRPRAGHADAAGDGGQALSTGPTRCAASSGSPRRFAWTRRSGARRWRDQGVARAPDAGDRRKCFRRRLERALGGARRGRVARADEDALGGRLAQPGGGDLAVGARGLAGALLGVGGLLGSRHAPGSEAARTNRSQRAITARGRERRRRRRRARRGRARRLGNGYGHPITLVPRARIFRSGGVASGAAVPGPPSVFPTPDAASGPDGEPHRPPAEHLDRLTGAQAAMSCASSRNRRRSTRSAGSPMIAGMMSSSPR